MRVIVKSLKSSLRYDAFAFGEARRKCRKHVFQNARIRHEPAKLINGPIFGANLFPNHLVQEAIEAASRANQSLRTRWDLPLKRKYTEGHGPQTKNRDTHWSKRSSFKVPKVPQAAPQVIPVSATAPGPSQYVLLPTFSQSPVYSQTYERPSTFRPPGFSYQHQGRKSGRSRGRSFHFHRSHRRLLGREVFAFTTMLFGLNIAPRFYTKLVDSVVQELHSQGILVATYLDDWIIWAISPQACREAAHKTMQFLQKLGFQVNIRKSRLHPEKKFQRMGLGWDLVQHNLALPCTKCKNIAKATRQFIRGHQGSRRAKERILASLQFASTTDPVLKARLKDINRTWGSRATSKLRDKRSRIPQVLVKGLSQWSTEKSL